MPADNVEGSQAADWLAKKAKKVFVVDDLSDYGKGVADAVAAGAQEAKGVTVTSQGVDAKTTDYGPIAQKVAQLRCRGDVLRRLRRPGGAVRQGAARRPATRA